MKKRLFLSSLLAVCVASVVQAGDTTHVDKITGPLSSNITGDVDTNYVNVGSGYVTIPGSLIINSNYPTATENCWVKAGATLEATSITFNSQTKFNLETMTGWESKFTIRGTIKTDSIIVSAEEGCEAELFISYGKLESLTSGTTGTIQVGANSLFNLMGPTAKYQASVGLNTVVDGGALVVQGYSSMSGITLESGTATIKKGAIGDLGDITMNGGSFSLEEAAITSDITMTSGTLQFLGDSQTGDLTLNGGAIYFGEDLTAAAVGLASNDGVTTVTTGALTLNSGTIFIADNYVINLGNEDLILSDNVAITMNVASLDNIEGVELFKTTGNVAGLDKLSVTLVDSTGATMETSASYSNGSVVTALIPEPTTATLSLLALAGLAARRRRK